MKRTVKIQPVLDIDEELVLPFRFARALNGESITSVLALTCEAYNGTDPQAQQCFVGVPEIRGTDVLQVFRPRKSGVTYLVRCTVLTPTTKHTAAAYIPVQRLGKELAP